MQNKDLHRFSTGLNKDDNPIDLTPGEYTDALNMRVASSEEQQGIGIMETLQGEVELAISVLVPTYYGGSIGGSFVYQGVEAVQIGDQVWSTENYKEDYPGSRVFNDLESNRNIYGGLYTWDMIRSADFCPTGWRIPTLADWDQLFAYLGGDAIAGGKMKEAGTEHWLSPNTGATDESGFTAIGAGRYSEAAYELLHSKGLFWIYDDTDPIVSLFAFLWTGGVEDLDHLESDVSEDYITAEDLDFAESYIPEESESTFIMPDNDDLKDADTDRLWWTEAGVKRHVTVAELIGYDFERTFVKYDNAAPHNIQWIGLLKSDIVLTEDQITMLHTTFELSIFWSGFWNDNGFMKDNRGFEQLPWVP